MNQKIKVIVAEDLDLIREHFCNIINKEDDLDLVAAVASGKEVIQLLEQVEADVVLMDIEMDYKHDGIHAAKVILEKYPHIRIVFLTVHEDDETVFSAFETGAVDYVLKSSPISEIVASIRSAYEGNSPIRPKIAQKIRNEFSRIRKNQSRIAEAIIPLSQLTPTEKEILQLLLQNKKVSEIAKQRNVEISTVKSQINGILKKFNKKRSKEVVKLIKELNMTHLFFQLENYDG